MQVAARKIVPELRGPLFLSRDLAAFHSTSVSLAKWRSKWNSKDEGSFQKPSKTYIRYAVRQKRADAKKALKNFIFYGKPSKLHCQDEDIGCHTDRTSSSNSGKSKAHSSPSSGKYGGTKRSKNKYTFCYDDDYAPHETNFQADFRGHRGFTWCFSGGFNWKYKRWERTQRAEWNESDAEDDPTDIVSDTHRRTLGLSSTGPLTLDVVKCAFRASALKWHPDKHQGDSQAVAGERFKLCVDAYNALRDTLKSA